MSLKITPGSVSGDHVLLTGPISGTVTLENGTVIDVGPVAIEVTGQDEADEISFLIGERHRVEGHPDDVERDESGELVQRPFEHDVPEKFKGRVDKKAKTFGIPAATTKKKG